MLDFITQYFAIILFYVVIVLFLLLHRSKLDVQAKVMILYRMKFGLRFMDTAVAKARQWIIILGYIGTGIGFLGMVLISLVLLKNIIDLLFVPKAMAGVALVLPGVKVPGIGVLPFWYWLIAIFIIAIIHEFSHGIVARAHNVTVKNTGLVFMGPIIGAFVEPDEEKLPKEKDIVQYSILAAGSFSNILLAILAILLLNIVFAPLQDRMTVPTGFTFDSYHNESYPAALAQIPPGSLITSVDSKDITTFQQFNERLSCAHPGDSITLIAAAKTYDLILAENPDNRGHAFLGISEIHNEIKVKEQYQAGIGKVAYVLVDWTSGFLRWLFLLSLGIGLFNLLPLPIVDGGRMAQVALRSIYGPDKGEHRYRLLALFFLFILVASLVLPLALKVL